jgi:predicted Zn finger-like uncharacterized protein
MRNDCPSCQTVYAVTSHDIGKRIICKQCGAALVIAEDGFRLDLSVPAPSLPKSERDDESDDADPQPRKKRRRDAEPAAPKVPGRELEMAKEFYSKYVDIPTILFGIGAFFILTFLFFPMIGKAKHERRIGAMADEKLEMEQDIRKLREKPGNEEKIRKLEEDWTKRLPVLEADAKAAEISNQRSSYFDRYGMLFGFVLLMIGSLGMVRAETHLVKRIFGASVLGLQMLLVFANLLGGCRGLPGG